MKKLIKLLKVLADKNRIRILELLRSRKMCVCELAYILGITQPSVSRHLKKLKSAGLIGDQQEGLWTDYFLNKPDGFYGKALLANIHNCLVDDPMIISDRKKLRKVNRAKLCCRK